MKKLTIGLAIFGIVNILTALSFGYIAILTHNADGTWSSLATLHGVSGVFSLGLALCTWIEI